MLSADQINAFFEAGGGLFILNHCRALHRTKQPEGVSVISVAFFQLWGLFNLFYYPHLHQPASFVGGAFMVVCNTVWICMLVYYRMQQRQRSLAAIGQGDG